MSLVTPLLKMSAPEATTKGPTRCSQLAMGTAAFMAAAAAVVWVQSLWTAANGAPRQRIMAGCARTWPELELFLPLHMGVHSLPGAPRRQSINTKRRNEEYANWFFRSYFLFWPSEMSRTTIRVLFDEELRTDHNMTHLYVEANRTIHNCFARRAKVCPFSPLHAPPSISVLLTVAACACRSTRRSSTTTSSPRPSYPRRLPRPRTAPEWTASSGTCSGRTTSRAASTWASSTRTRSSSLTWTAKVRGPASFTHTWLSSVALTCNLRRPV